MLLHGVTANYATLLSHGLLHFCPANILQKAAMRIFPKQLVANKGFSPTNNISLVDGISDALQPSTRRLQTNTLSIFSLENVIVIV